MSRGIWLKTQAVATGATLIAGVAAAVASPAGEAVPQAGGRALALIQQAPASLASYASLKETLTISVATNGHSARIVAHGIVSPDGRNGTFSYDLPRGLPSIDLEFVGGVAYAPLPVEKRGLTGGKPYAALDMSGLSNPQLNPGNASTLLSLLAGAHGTVQDDGTAKVDGTPTRRYHLTIDVQEAYNRIPVNLRPAQVDLQALGQTLPMDVWLDRNGRLRRLRSVVAAGGVTATMQLSVRGTSTQLHLVAPPESDVFHVTDSQQLSAILAAR